ncbi:MAG: argS [Candidatus Magasanikbacteria bacterium]|nr:argS [Candidatus Magasanikbacteria bacterium]
MSAMDEIKTRIAKALQKIAPADFKIAANDFTAPPVPEMGDLSYPCFPFAKFTKQNPAVCGRELAEKLRHGVPGVSKIESVGPYLNFFLDQSSLAQKILHDVLKQGADYGRHVLPTSKKEIIMLEFSQPNTHKEFHVGHLRNTVLGASIVALLRAVGHKIIAANYQGDVGAHVAKCLWAYKKFHDGITPRLNRGRWLGEIYAEATREIEEHPEYKEEVAEVQRALEWRGQVLRGQIPTGSVPVEPDPYADPREWQKLWERTRLWSLDEFKKIYRELNVDFDKNYFESEVEAGGKKRVAQMLKEGRAQKSQGAIIMDYTPENLGVFLLLKSDGSSLYATKEIELAYRKFKDFPKLGKSIVITDERQILYFKQLFKTLELLGFDKTFVHIPYSFVTTPEGMMSSRSGNIIRYEDLRDALLKKALAETKKRHESWSAARVKKISHGLAMAAMKFTMLKQSPQTIITFDINEALSFDGFTAPYILYTYARLQSVQKKAGRVSIKEKALTYDFHELEERALIVALAQFPEIVLAAGQNYNPSEIAKYVFSLCQNVSDFYEKHSIVKSEPAMRAGRLMLVAACQQVIENGLRLLGIATIKEM